jgi:hypothetical protein
VTIARARSLRRTMTLSEVALWQALRPQRDEECASRIPSTGFAAPPSHEIVGRI